MCMHTYDVYAQSFNLHDLYLWSELSACMFVYVCMYHLVHACIDIRTRAQNMCMCLCVTRDMVLRTPHWATPLRLKGCFWNVWCKCFFSFQWQNFIHTGGAHPDIQGTWRCSWKIQISLALYKAVFVYTLLRYILYKQRTDHFPIAWVWMYASMYVCMYVCIDILFTTRAQTTSMLQIFLKKIQAHS